MALITVPNRHTKVEKRSSFLMYGSLFIGSCYNYTIKDDCYYYLHEPNCKLQYRLTLQVGNLVGPTLFWLFLCLPLSIQAEFAEQLDNMAQQKTKVNPTKSHSGSCAIREHQRGRGVAKKQIRADKSRRGGGGRVSSDVHRRRGFSLKRTSSNKGGGGGQKVFLHSITRSKLC